MGAKKSKKGKGKYAVYRQKGKKVRKVYSGKCECGESITVATKDKKSKCWRCRKQKSKKKYA